MITGFVNVLHNCNTNFQQKQTQKSQNQHKEAQKLHILKLLQHKHSHIYKHTNKWRDKHIFIYVIS